MRGLVLAKAAVLLAVVSTVPPSAYADTSGGYQGGGV